MNRIVSYQPVHKADFRRINAESISETFALEAHDLEQLDSPETYILSEGGTILLAEYEGRIVGTVGLVRSGADEYELVKLAVSKAWRQIGVGRRLCRAAVDYARQKGARRVWLEANTALKTALHIYESLGFSRIPLSPSPYRRADVRMELRLGEGVRWSAAGGWLLDRKFK